MRTSSKKAFTMIELVFVIVVIGILAAIAVPKLAATRDDATITKARTVVASVRNAIAAERQKRILRGDFVSPITSLNTGTATVFDVFNADRDGTQDRVLEYSVPSCATLGKTRECWQMQGTDYRYMMPNSGFVDFSIVNNRFVCKIPADPNCLLLTK